MTVVVGLDPSLTGTGIATPTGCTTVTSTGRGNASLADRAARLHKLAAQIVTVVRAAAEPAGHLLVVIERQIPTAGGHGHDRSGLWWLLVDALLEDPAVQIVEITPSQRMKYATGRGRADKDEVLAAVIRRYPDVEVRNNNEADALVFRAMGCDYIGAPLVELPLNHRAALDKVAWPS